MTEREAVLWVIDAFQMIDREELEKMFGPGRREEPARLGYLDRINELIRAARQKEMQTKKSKVISINVRLVDNEAGGLEIGMEVWDGEDPETAEFLGFKVKFDWILDERLFEVEYIMES